MTTTLIENLTADAPPIEDVECDAGPLEHDGRRIVLPPLCPPDPTQVATVHGRSRVLERLLAMADTYYHGGSLRQAIELYFELVNDYAGTPEADEAEERLLDVGRDYEQSGELRQARGIYEQLL